MRALFSPYPAYMDKNQIVGILLILALIVGVQFFFSSDEAAPTGPAQTEGESTTDTPSEALATTPTEVIPSVALADMDSTQRALMQARLEGQYGIFGAAADGQSQEVILENEQLRVVLDTKGGMFKQATLSEFQQFWSKEDVNLWDEEQSRMALEFQIPGKGQVATSDLYFAPSGHTQTASESQAAQVVMTLPTADPSKQLSYTYSLAAGSYEVTCTVAMVNLQSDMGMPEANLVWDAWGWHNEKGLQNEQRHASVFFREMEEDRDYLSEGRDDDDVVEGRLNWMTFKQHFFSAMVINDQGFGPGAALTVAAPLETDTAHTKHYSAVMPLGVQSSAAATVPLRFYLGPNEYENLIGLETEDAVRIIDYGWGLFGWVNRHFIRPVFNFLSNYIGSAGIVIIILTMLIKMLLFPVTWKNYLSSARMKVLRPEMDEINKKFKDKPAAEKQAATMELYRKTGVNPFAGCIPVLLQMPILYAMFRFFPSCIELRGEGFWWADDLAAYDAIVTWTGDFGFFSSIYGNHISGFTVLMAISTFFYTRMNSASLPQQSQPGMPNMKIIMNIFPFMMLIFFNQFASGLSFYYLIANVFSIAQMWVIKKYIIDEDKIRSKIENNKQQPKKQSGFQARLAELQRAQQDKAKQPRK